MLLNTGRKPGRPKSYKSLTDGIQTFSTLGNFQNTDRISVHVSLSSVRQGESNTCSTQSSYLSRKMGATLSDSEGIGVFSCRDSSVVLWILLNHCKLNYKYTVKSFSFILHGAEMRRSENPPLLIAATKSRPLWHALNE